MSTYVNNQTSYPKSNSTNQASYAPSYIRKKNATSYNYQDQNNCGELIEGNINQVNYNNIKIIELIDLINRLKEINAILKNENKKFTNDISQMKIQIEDLTEENKNLMTKDMELGKEFQKLIVLKNENERLNNELMNLRNKYNIQFEEYKQMKENEINILNSQIRDLENSQKNLEVINSQLMEENNNLKSRLTDIIKNNNNMNNILSEKDTQINDLENRIKTIINNNNNMNNILREKDTQINGLENRITTIIKNNNNIKVYKGQIIKNKDELEFLTRRISQLYRRITLNLIYKATADSDRAEIFHEKCDIANSSIVLIESGNGRRFGGFTTCNWRGNSINKNDDNAFVFSLDKMRIYNIIPGEEAIGCYRNFGPVFMGCQIKINDEAFTKGGTTYLKGTNYETSEDYELSGGLKNFSVKEIEVYEVEPN